MSEQRAARGTSKRAKGNIPADVPRIAYSVTEFAAGIGVNYQTALRMVHRGEVGHFLAGSEFRIPVSEVKRLIDEANERRTA
jgi:excisionase family DNA binding protein